MAKKTPGEWWIEKNYPPAMLYDPGIMSVDQQYNICFNDLLSCVYQVIQFDGLPPSIDPTYFRMCLFLGGRVCIFRDTKGNSEIRALDCSTAGSNTIYYMPEYIQISNPTFKGYSYTKLTPGEDCAIIFCREVDRYQYGREVGGMFGLISTTAQLLADNTVSLNVAQKNMRLVNILAAEDDNTKESIRITIEKMYAGAPYIPVMKTLIDKLESVPLTDQTNTTQLLQLLQVRQYILSHFYECLGLKTHDQMKKERLISAEMDDGIELAIFNIQDMLYEVQRGIDEANRIFGLEIKMHLHPLIANTLDNPEDAAEELADDQSDGSGDGEPEEPADDQSDGSGDGEPEEPADDQSDGSGDGEPEEPADDQSDGSGDGEPEEPAELVDAAAELVSAAAELVSAAAELVEPEAEQEVKNDELLSD